MAEWNKNNRACTTTWTTLKVLDQNRKVFKDSGSVKMTELTFWNLLASAEMRKIQTTALANQIDNVLVQIRRAKYEQGVDKEKAVNDIVSTLSGEDKTISDLAAAVDIDYLFWGEQDSE